MSTGAVGDDSARVRWLLVGAFSAEPTGARHVLTPDTLPEVMARVGLGGKVSVPDRLGAGDTRSVEVSFNKPKAFVLTEMLGAVPELKALRALGDELGSSDATKRPAPDAALARIEQLVGRGKLYAAVEKALVGDKPAAPAAKPAEGSSAAPTGNVDAIFANAQVAAATPKSALDSFVKNMRAGSGDANRPATSTTAAKAARTAIEDAVFGTAVDVMKDPLISRLESSWRALKLVVDQCTTSSGMQVEIVDAAVEKALGALQASLPDDPIDYPEALFFVDPITDADTVAQIGQLAENCNAPAVVYLPPKFFGTDDAAQVSSRVEDDGVLPKEWSGVRSDEVSRWVCAVTNRFVVAAEGSGAAKRVVFASPVFAIAAMLAQSYRNTGSFARIIGAPGSLKAPGVWDLPSGREAGNAVPTEAFFSVRAQSKLAALGVVGLGSGRNSDAITLTTAPTVRGGDDLVPLPAQILTGRVVRFAQWCRDQVPAGASDGEVMTLFEQAAGVFLFPGSTEGGLKAQIIADKDNKGRGVLVSASVKAEHAGTPFHLAFQLPLGK